MAIKKKTLAYLLEAALPYFRKLGHAPSSEQCLLCLTYDVYATLTERNIGDVLNEKKDAKTYSPYQIPAFLSYVPVCAVPNPYKEPVESYNIPPPPVSPGEMGT